MGQRKTLTKKENLNKLQKLNFSLVKERHLIELNKSDSPFLCAFPACRCLHQEYICRNGNCTNSTELYTLVWGTFWVHNRSKLHKWFYKRSECKFEKILAAKILRECGINCAQQISTWKSDWESIVKCSPLAMRGTPFSLCLLFCVPLLIFRVLALDAGTTMSLQQNEWNEKISPQPASACHFCVRFHLKMTNLCKKMKNVEIVILRGQDGTQ